MLPIMAAMHPDVYPGFREVLPALAERYKLFIVSNCDAGYIEMFLDTTSLGDLFIDHLCPGDTGEGKAENIRTLITRHHLADTVYVGDTENDRLATKEAGIPFIFADYGYGKTEASCPVIEEPADLLKLL